MSNSSALRQLIRPVVSRAFSNKRTEQNFQQYNRALALQAFPLVINFMLSGWLLIWVMTLFFSHWIPLQTRLIGIAGVACSLCLTMKYLVRFLSAFDKYFVQIAFCICASLHFLFTCLEYIYRPPHEGGFLYSSLTALAYIEIIGFFAFVRPSLKLGLLLSAWVVFLTLFFLYKAYPADHQSLIRVATYQYFAISLGFVIRGIMQNNDRRIFIKIIRLARIAEHRKKLIAQVKAANHANRAKTAFLATISHEIRTPLHGIMGMVSLLNSRKLLSAPADKKIADAINISAGRLLTTLNDILDFAQSENGNIMQLMPSVFAAEDIILDCKAIFEGTASLKGIDLFFLTNGENSSMPIFADKNKLARVVINLISNAIKFTPAGGSVTVKSKVVVNGMEDGFVGIFEVLDTGIGVAEIHLNQIFQPFFQVNQGDTRAQQGNGLGLAICQQIVAAMNGEIAIQSEQNKGTAFKIFIPLQKGNATIN